jgi:hypothetical protein
MLKSRKGGKMSTRQKFLLLFLLLTAGMMSSVLAQNAFLYVEPETTIAQPGDSFSINFDIADVESLYLWQIYLSWDAAVLHLKRVEEGPFLSMNGQKTTFFVTNYDDTSNGYVLFGATLIGSPPPTSGSGTLSYGYFSVKANGVSPLILETEGTWRTYLCDNNMNEIPFTKRDGFFTTEVGLEEKNITRNLYFRFKEIFPNPFKKTAMISYHLSDISYITLEIYNNVGQLVRTLVKEKQNMGNYRVTWNGKDNKGERIAAGIYFCQLQCGGEREIKKLIIIR